MVIDCKCKHIRHVDFEAIRLNPEVTEYDTDKYDKGLTLTFFVNTKNGLFKYEHLFCLQMVN